MTDTRHGQWLQSFSGKCIYPADPRPEDVFLEDIAHALSFQCRYGGHVREFYSISQHSVLVADSVPRAWKLEALLHDASEAYIVDIPRPLKQQLSEYATYESLWMEAICERFGLLYTADAWAAIKDIDNRILLSERNALLRPPPRPWTVYGPPLDIQIVPWSPKVAEMTFTNVFRSLWWERHGTWYAESEV